MNRQARDGMRLDLHAQFGQLAPYLVGVAAAPTLGKSLAIRPAGPMITVDRAYFDAPEAEAVS